MQKPSSLSCGHSFTNGDMTTAIPDGIAVDSAASSGANLQASQLINRPLTQLF